MDFPWQIPSFLTTANVSLRATTGHRVLLPPGVADRMAMPIQNFARMVHGVLDPSECAALIASVNEKGFSPALTNYGDGCQVYDPRYRSSGRCIVDSVDLARHLFHILRPHLPPVFYAGTRAEIRVHELNERMRVLCYSPGDKFHPHCDGCYYRPETHPSAGSKSVVTVQLYLNDLPEENGGATTFIGRDRRVPCQPTAGSALIFTQNLYHEGSELTRGFKYVIRTEAMYAPAAR
jgi:hypothetical protein